MAETPLTITVSVWNYCQNTCPYCVSGSNLPKWDWNGSFEVFTPAGGEGLNDLQLQHTFGRWYYQNLCPDRERFLNSHNVLELPFLLRWLQLHTPKAVLHLSGGEPLLRPDIEDFTRQLVEAGFEVTMVTNGLLIPNRPELLGLPLKWIVTHHDPQPLSDFMKCIDPIRDKPHQITRVFDVGAGAGAGGDYSGFNFVPRWRDAPRLKRWFRFRPGDVQRIASEVLHFISPDGRVFPCNSMMWDPIGHIYTGKYKTGPYLDMVNMTCRKCVERNICGAYQTAVEASKLTSALSRVSWA